MDNKITNEVKLRREKLKEYIKRLDNGEDLESVRADFVKEFQYVESMEIMEAEQELIREGTPIEKVQKLCDVHSALFHGKTREEKIANAEKDVEESLMKREVQQILEKRKNFVEKDYSNKKELAAKLEEIPGHPLHTLKMENQVLSKVLEEYEKEGSPHLLPIISEISIHYAKKGDLLYPLLKSQYDISGPADVMWTVDDEIRDEIRALNREGNQDENWHRRISIVLKKIEEMIYKEENILFPICAVNFTTKEWQGIYHDSKDYDSCFGVKSQVWNDGELYKSGETYNPDNHVILGGGHMTIGQLTAMLNTIPLEITFIDGENINRYFNEGSKVFKRPSMAIDREVFSCHPPKIQPMVESIIADFRNGKCDSVPIWMEKGGETMIVTYMAVRDKENKYIGTMEIVQNMEFAKAHFQNK